MKEAKKVKKRKKEEEEEKEWRGRTVFCQAEV